MSEPCSWSQIYVQKLAIKQREGCGNYSWDLILCCAGFIFSAVPNHLNVCLLSSLSSVLKSMQNSSLKYPGHEALRRKKYIDNRIFSPNVFRHLVCPGYCYLGTAPVLYVTQGHKDICLHCAEQSVKKNNPCSEVLISKKEMKLADNLPFNSVGWTGCKHHTGLVTLSSLLLWGTFWNFPSCPLPQKCSLLCSSYSISTPQLSVSWTFTFHCFFHSIVA